MTVEALGALSGLSALGVAAPRSVASTDGSDFAGVLASAVDGIQAQQATAKDLAVTAVTGDLTDIHDATIAATRAQVVLELAAAVRNKGVDGFNEIMRMQA